MTEKNLFISYKAKICCPHCGKPTHSLKFFNIATGMGIGYRFPEKLPVIGCPTCMTRQNLWRSLNDNIIRLNIFWLWIILPIFTITFIRSLIPGHSKTIKRQIDLYNQSSTNSVAKAYHNWTGITGIVPPFTLLRKWECKTATKIAKAHHSFVWLAKAWCYSHELNFHISFNGRALACGEDTTRPEFVAFDHESGSDLYYRDFFILAPEYKHLKQDALSFLSQIKDELSIIADVDPSFNTHFHAKCLYQVDFNEQPIEQLDWISERITEIRTDFLKWFNQTKLIAPDETKLI